MILMNVWMHLIGTMMARSIGADAGLNLMQEM
jgi:hypothetical protein